MTVACQTPRRTVVFVSNGGNCRAPMAVGVLSRLLHESGRQGAIKVEAVAVSGVHVGDPVDPMALEAASSRGYDIRSIRVRKVERRDFDAMAMFAADTLVLALLRNMAPHGLADRPQLLARYTPLRLDNIVDPYGGELPDYHAALGLIEASCKGILPLLSQMGGTGPT